jgi:hypothetical protein
MTSGPGIGLPGEGHYSEELVVICPRCTFKIAVPEGSEGDYECPQCDMLISEDYVREHGKRL